MSDVDPGRTTDDDGLAADWGTFLEDRYADDLIDIFVGESDDRILRVDWEDIERMDWYLAEALDAKRAGVCPFRSNIPIRRPVKSPYSPRRRK